MIKYVEIKKRINNQIETIMPKTSTNVTMYIDGRNLTEVLSGIISDLITVKNMLGIAGNVYVLDENGEKIADDSGSQDYLIALNDVPDNSLTIYIQDKDGNNIDDGSNSNLVALNTLKDTYE